MRRCSAAVICALIVAGCAAPIKQFYPGTYFPEDRTYQNKSIGFSLTYRGSWELVTDPNLMKENKKYAQECQQSGLELLFVGFTAEKMQGTRCIVGNLNETSTEWADYVRRINTTRVDKDFGTTPDTLHGISMMRWEYAKNEIRFVEFFFSVDTYNIRVAFWTTPDLYDKFLPVYKDIMNTLSITDPE